MKILGVGACLPSKQMTNQAVLDLVEAQSAPLFDGDLPRSLKGVARLLTQSGFETRHWLADGEQPIELMQNAFDRALAQARIAAEDIDLLVFAGVSRGFIEPANSTFVANALGLSCRNFDVVDACMGWMTAMELVNDRMRVGSVRYAAIVNMEFGTMPGGVIAKSHQLRDAADLASKCACFTIGEAAAVTLVSNDSPLNFRFNYVSSPDLSELCTISLPGWEAFCSASDIERIGPAGGDFQFRSDGRALHNIAEAEIVEAFCVSGVDPANLDVVLTHTSSPNRWKHFCRSIGARDKLHMVADRTGNVSTASIPLGLADASERGVLRKGHRCMAWVGGGGMSFCAATFQY